MEPFYPSPGSAGERAAEHRSSDTLATRQVAIWWQIPRSRRFAQVRAVERSRAQLVDL